MMLDDVMFIGAVIIVITLIVIVMNEFFIDFIDYLLFSKWLTLWANIKLIYRKYWYVFIIIVIIHKLLNKSIITINWLSLVHSILDSKFLYKFVIIISVSSILIICIVIIMRKVRIRVIS